MVLDDPLSSCVLPGFEWDPSGPIVGGWVDVYSSCLPRQIKEEAHLHQDAIQMLTQQPKPRRRTPAVLATVALILGVASTGCDVQEYATSITDFGTAVATVVQQTKNAYQLVNDTSVQKEVLAYSIKSSPIGKPKMAFLPFLGDDDLAIRMTMLDALQAYATALTSLTGKTTTDLDTETTKFAGAITALAKNVRLQHSLHEVNDVSPQEINAAATALDAIGKFLIERKISQKLPAILKESQPTIEAIATIFIREIGAPPDSPNAGRLRGKLGRDYEHMIEDQAMIVDGNIAGSAEKEQNIAKLARLVTAQRDADATLAKIQTALAQLVQAHKALLQVQSTPATFKTVVASLWAQTKDIQDFYAKLPSK